jgi:transposase-like protein
MSRNRYTEEIKIEAVKQVTGRGYSVAEVASRLTEHEALIFPLPDHYRDHLDQVSSALRHPVIPP